MRILVTVLGNRDPINGTAFGPILSHLAEVCREGNPAYHKVCLLGICGFEPKSSQFRQYVARRDELVKSIEEKFFITCEFVKEVHCANPSSREHAFRAIYSQFFQLINQETLPLADLQFYVSPGTPATREALTNLAWMVLNAGYTSNVLQRSENSEIGTIQTPDALGVFGHLLQERGLDRAFGMAEAMQWKAAEVQLKRDYKRWAKVHLRGLSRMDSTIRLFAVMHELNTEASRSLNPFREEFGSDLPTLATLIKTARGYHPENIIELAVHCFLKLASSALTEQAVEQRAALEAALRLKAYAVRLDLSKANTAGQVKGVLMGALKGPNGRAIFDGELSRGVALTLGVSSRNTPASEWNNVLRRCGEVIHSLNDGVHLGQGVDNLSDVFKLTAKLLNLDVAELRKRVDEYNSGMQRDLARLHLSLDRELNGN